MKGGIMRVYKVTLIVSTIIFSVLTVAAVCLHFLGTNFDLAFLVNWLVGIACSIVVVIITTSIQFRVEQKRAIQQVAELTVDLQIAFEVCNDTINSDYWENYSNPERKEFFLHLFKETTDFTEEIEKLTADIVYFSCKKEKINTRIHKTQGLIKILLTKEGMEFITFLICEKHIIEMADNVLKLNTKGYYYKKCLLLNNSLKEASKQFDKEICHP
jgi:hypothetical protein